MNKIKVRVEVIAYVEAGKVPQFLKAVQAAASANSSTSIVERKP